MNTTDARNGPGTVAKASDFSEESKAQDFAVIKAVLSPEKFESHRSHAGEPDDIVFARHEWNAVVCEHFYGPLRTLEVILRNSLDRAIAVKVKDGNWLSKIPPWLRPKEQRDVIEAHRFLASRGRAITQSRMVQEMGFGFWTSFFNSKHCFIPSQDTCCQVCRGRNVPEEMRHSASKAFETSAIGYFIFAGSGIVPILKVTTTALWRQ